MNCFEQLTHLGTEAPHVFENIVGMLVSQKFQQAHRTRLSQGDSGVDVWRWEGNQDGQRIFQVKFYVGKLKTRQKAEIEASYEMAHSSPVVKMRHWTLCLPGRLSIEDSHWLVEFLRKRSDVKIDLLDGDALLEILRAPGAAHARRELSARGMTGIPDGGAAILPVLYVDVENARKAHFDAVAFIMITNDGDRSVRELKVHVKFTSDTGYLAYFPSEARWQRIRSGILDCPSDFEIHARHPIHAGENLEVVQIPLRPKNFSFALDIYGDDMEPTFWLLKLPERAFLTGGRFEFEKHAKSARALVEQAKSQPSLSEASMILATEMLQIDDPTERGISHILSGVPGYDHHSAFYPWLRRGGQGVKFLEAESFEYAVAELVKLGFLKDIRYSADGGVGIYVFRPESEERLRNLLAQSVK